MKNQTHLIVKIFILLFISTTGFAFTPLGSENSIFSNNSGGPKLFEDGYGQEVILSASQGGATFGGGNTSLSLSGGYGYFFMPRVEGTLHLNFNSVSTVDASHSVIQLFYDGIYNFDDSPQSAYFVMLGLGTETVFSGSYAMTQAGFRVGGGKRIPIWGSVNLMPMAYLQKMGNTSEMTTNVIPLNFSVLL